MTRAITGPALPYLLTDTSKRQSLYILWWLFFYSAFDVDVDVDAVVAFASSGLGTHRTTFSGGMGTGGVGVGALQRSEVNPNLLVHDVSWATLQVKQAALAKQ